MITDNLFQTSIKSSDEISYIIEDWRTCSLFPWNLDPHLSKYYTPTRCIGISWELVRKAESLAFPPTTLSPMYWIRIYISARFPEQKYGSSIYLWSKLIIKHIKAFYIFAFTELWLPLYCSFHWSPPQETLMESSTISANSMLSRVRSVNLHWLLKLKSHGRKLF